VKSLSKLEQPGGLVMSPYETEGQWDFPYAWAPTQMIAMEGLRRYGFNHDADRISYNFLSMLAENFRRDGTIREKYNAVTRSSENCRQSRLQHQRRRIWMDKRGIRRISA